MSRSARWLERGEKVVPVGVNSPVRAFKAVGGEPPFIARGEGVELIDEDGHRYIDCICSWGALMLGHAPDEVVATEPMSWDARQLVESLGVTTVRSNQFLCHYDEFADWADGRKQLKMEDFYRWQRRRLGYLMDGDEPVTGRWNYDDENRQRPPNCPDPEVSPQFARGRAGHRRLSLFLSDAVILAPH